MRACTRVHDSYRVNTHNTKLSNYGVNKYGGIAAMTITNNQLKQSIHRVTVTQFLHIISMPAVFPPFCGTSSAKCLLF